MLYDSCKIAKMEDVCRQDFAQFPCRAVFMTYVSVINFRIRSSLFRGLSDAWRGKNNFPSCFQLAQSYFMFRSHRTHTRSKTWRTCEQNLNFLKSNTCKYLRCRIGFLIFNDTGQIQFLQPSWNVWHVNAIEAGKQWKL